MSVHKMIDSNEELEIVYFSKSRAAEFVIPDGGYGWATVFAAFMNAALIDGTFYSFGIFRIYLIDYLLMKGSASFAVNLIGAFQLSFPYLTGPIISMLGQEYGFRKMSIIGGLTSAVCYLICFLSPPNIIVFYIFYGIINGFGLGMIFMCGIITISQYFDKKLPLSTGLAVCGSGFGICIMSTLMNVIINNYSWHGTLLILSGISLQTVLFSSLLRFPYRQFRQDYASKSSINRSQMIRSDQIQPTLNDSMILSKEAINTVIKSGFISSYIDIGSMIETMGGPVTNDMGPDNVMFFRSIGSITGVPMSFFTQEQMQRDIDARVNSNIAMSKMTVREKRLAIFKILYLRPPCFRELKLFLYYMSALLLSFSYSVPFYYSTAKLINILNISETKAGFVISIIGFSSLICRVIIGSLATMLPNYKLWFYIACLIIQGISNFVFTFLTSYWALLGWGVVTGATLGGVVTLETVILTEMVSLEDLASAFGAYQMTCGTGTILGPPLTGIIFDVCNNHDVPFYFAGVIFMLSGIVTIPIIWMRNKT